MGGVEKTTDEQGIVKLVKDSRNQSVSAHTDWRDEARENYDMVAGDQWADGAKEELEDEGRPAVTFNRLGTIIDAVSGSEVNNRQEVRYIPREIGDVQTNEVLTSAAQWVRDNCDAEDEESDSFVDVLITGVGWTETRMEYETDEEGQCVIERVDPLEMRWDPAARKRNLSDARWVQRERGFTKDEIEARWPDTAGELKSNPVWDDEEENTLEVESEPDGYKGGKSGTDRNRKLYAVIQHQWYDTECFYKVLSPESGQIVELSEEKYKAVEEAQAMAGMPPMQSAKLRRRVYKQAFVCGETLLEVGPCPCKHDFTFQAITGRRDRNTGVWYGLVRPMRDPQRWANKFFSQLLHIINTNAKGGLVMEEGAAANPRKFEKDWAKANSIAKVNAGGLNKIMPKPLPAIPPVISELMNFSISSIRDTSGVSLELLGMADREQAGYLEAQRTKAGLTILAPFFDALRLYRKRQGRVMVYFIQEYLSDGRLIKIVGKDREQFVPLIKMPDAMKFDVIVDSAPTSRDMKEKTWAALMELLPLVQGMGIPIPPELIDYAPLPSGLVAAWKPKLLQAQQKMEQGDPMQKAMQAAQVEKAKADVEKTYASADQAQSAAQLNFIKAQVESMAPTLQAIQMALQAFVPKPGPEGQQATPGQSPQPMGQQAPQQPPSGGFFTPENGPTPVQ